MKWQTKLLKNSLVGILPLSIQENLRKIKRKFLPHDVNLDLWTLQQGLHQVEMLRTTGYEPFGKDYLELGTGWSPVIPIIFALAGCKSLTLIDSQRLMDNHTFHVTCKQLADHTQDISQIIRIPADTIEQKLVRLSTLSLEASLKELNCNYLAPNDFLKNDFPDSSFDIITSRAVMEHVPPKFVKEIYAEFKRILRYKGAMCHIIDNSDHWEHHDKSISRLNFLKFSQRTFDIFSSMNPLDYQNRLRHSQYKKIIESSGLNIIHDESIPDELTLSSLNILDFHDSFRTFATDDLAILTSYIVVAK